MFISVIIPVYNVSPSLLSHCLRSVHAQTLRADEYEIIVVDDCSTSEITLDAIESARNDRGSIKIVKHQDNLGVNAARKTGVKTANGTHIIILDSDDFFARDALETLRIKYLQTRAEVITAPFVRWNLQSKTYSRVKIHERPFSNNKTERLAGLVSVKHSFSMCGRLFERNILTEDVFDLPPHVLHQDITTFSRLMFRCNKVAHTPKPLYYYSVNPESTTSTFTVRHLEGIFRAFDEWLLLSENIGISTKLMPHISDGVAKLVSNCVRRCATDPSLDRKEKENILEVIYTRYNSLPVTPPSFYNDELRLLKSLSLSDFEECGLRSEKSINAIVSALTPKTQSEADPDSAEQWLPSDVAKLVKDRVVFICQSNYHLRNACACAEVLIKRGVPCVVLDNSKFASGGKRQLSGAEKKNLFRRVRRMVITEPPYGIDWLSTARLVLTYNDINEHIREALEYRNALGLPCIGVVEGISDFLRADLDHTRYLPYRRSDVVFLAGEDDKKHFLDRETYVTGLPIIEELMKKEVRFPNTAKAALNVNFTYGVLEENRDFYVKEAQRAFRECEVDWEITQHPMDSGKLDGLPVADDDQYAVIQRSTVFVSRFATGIMEALACGKPAIYFNPHNEKVAKFKEPEGAFRIANSCSELVGALRETFKEVDEGVDFRRKAKSFLARHAAFEEGGSSVERFADAACEVADRGDISGKELATLFFEKVSGRKAVTKPPKASRFGAFRRSERAHLNEGELLERYFEGRNGTLFDVGANVGSFLRGFLRKGWKVHAFEPDPINRSKLIATYGGAKSLVISAQAVSNMDDAVVPLYGSDESAGISSLSAFTERHKRIGEARTTTLKTYCERIDLRHVDFLKSDAEGHDKFVLEGYPWNISRPEIVLAEFEDRKTKPLGYSVHDLASFLQDKGYAVFVSEWHPIIRYGITHDWKQFLRYDEGLVLNESWGNLIAFRKEPDLERILQLVKLCVKFNEPRKKHPEERSASHSTHGDHSSGWGFGLGVGPAVTGRTIGGIKGANHIFREGMHEEALKMYETLLREGGIYKTVIANIEVCKRILRQKEK